MKKIEEIACVGDKNMVDFDIKVSYDVYDLKKLVALLRSEKGCPWDREQSHESIRRNLIEEAYEAAEAIDEKDLNHLKEELGDVLTQVVFHAQIEEEAGNYDLDSVADAVCKKLIFRHPHIFGDVKADSAGEVLANWDEIKRRERQHDTVTASMDTVARSLPALWRAEKIQAKAEKTGFNHENIQAAVKKLQEELDELKSAIEGEGNVIEELGDIFFTAVNIAGFLKADPEIVLNESCDKFIKRFSHIEKHAKELGGELSDLPLSEMDKLYNQAKSIVD